MLPLWQAFRWPPIARSGFRDAMACRCGRQWTLMAKAHVASRWIRAPHKQLPSSLVQLPSPCPHKLLRSYWQRYAAWVHTHLDASAQGSALERGQAEVLVAQNQVLGLAQMTKETYEAQRDLS